MPNSGKPVQQPPQPWLGRLLNLFTCCGLVFVLFFMPIFLLEVTEGVSFTFVYISTFFICAASGFWSALGTGRYVTLVLLGVIVLAFGALGAWIASSQPNIFEDFPLLSVYLWMFSLLVAAQLPFWIMHLLAGWRLRPKSELFATATSLKGLFSIVFVFALAMGGQQLATRIYFDSVLDEISIGAEVERYVEKADQSNVYTIESVIVTEENFEKLRAEAKVRFQQGFLVYCVVTMLVGVVLLPIVWCWLRWRFFTAASASAVYLSGVYLILRFSIIPVPSGSSQWLDELVLALGWLAIGCLFSLVCWWFRRRGLELHSRWFKDNLSCQS